VLFFSIFSLICTTFSGSKWDEVNERFINICVFKSDSFYWRSSRKVSLCCFEISYFLIILGHGPSDAHKNVNEKYGDKTVSINMARSWFEKYDPDTKQLYVCLIYLYILGF
jgi:hypothetical protein